MAYTVLGLSDEVTTCGCCGRSDLKATVALQDADGNVHYFGRDCAARAAGRSVAAEVRAAQRAGREAEQAARQAESRRETELWLNWLAEKTGTTEAAVGIRALGGFAEARRLYREWQSR